MKLVIIGGTGLIGSTLVVKLRERGYDARARYFGALFGLRTLAPADDARLGEVRFSEWLNQPVLRQAHIPREFRCLTCRWNLDS